MLPNHVVMIQRICIKFDTHRERDYRINIMQTIFIIVGYILTLTFRAKPCRKTSMIQKALTILNTPEATHTIKLALTEPVYLNTPVGETKIPLPMIEPTITVMPFINDIFASKAPDSFVSGSRSGSDFKVSLSHSSSLLFGDLQKKI